MTSFLHIIRVSGQSISNNNGHFDHFDQFDHLSFSVILFQSSPSKHPKRGEGEEDHAAIRTNPRLMVQSEVEYVVVEDREDGDGEKDSRQIQTTQLATVLLMKL